jgi:NSS family neurotransmitter:Na+ symporter
MDEGNGKGLREDWGGRSAFVLAAIGSAVGLGNLWGFPYKLYSYGGGAFLIPYFIAMLLIGLPLLIMEFSVGHWAQNSPPGAFARVLGRYRFVGWWLVALAFVIITYYAIILGYSLVMLWDSVLANFGRPLPWAGGVDQANEAFFTGLLGYEKTLALSGPRWPVLLGLLASWGLIYLCLFRGVKWVSKVVLITVPLPWLMLVVLTIRGVTLDGATTGLNYYLDPDWSKLAQADTWRFAFGQVFFSLSLGFAVMLSYASFLHRKSDLNNNAAIIGLSDLATSFIAGIAVFATLGNMALLSDAPVDKVVAGGPGLAFAVYPYALSQLPAGAAVFSVIFFVALLTLGIDSAFSIVEAVQTSINDNRSPRWHRRWTLPAVCLVGLLAGLPYVFAGGGLNWLSLMDDQINGPFGILSVALAECLVVGWAWKGRFVSEMRAHANENSDWRLGVWWEVIVRFVAPIFLLTLIAWSISDTMAQDCWIDAEKRVGFGWQYALATVIGFVVFALIPVGFLLFCRKDQEASPADGDRSGAVWPILVLPGLAALLGLIWGGIRLSLKADAAQAAPVATVGFQVRELGGTAYLVLAVAFLVIFGGLIWCFFMAMKAAGGRDQQLQD